ncbi:MAG TPA: hypothetical protein VM580_25110 [Labilithrix sp.]|nr:hypothetical protein [Labilithrix sp.]
MLAQSLILVPLLGIAVLMLARRGLDAREQQLVVYGWLAHLIGAFGLVIYHEYIFRGGDMYLYHHYGREVARLMRDDFVLYAPEAVNLTLQRETVFPFGVLLGGTSTASMMGITSFASLLFGDSIYGLCVAFSFFSFLGTVQSYKAVRFKLNSGERVPALSGILLVPSVIFWTAGIVKEGVVVAALGCLLGSISDVLVRRRILASVPIPFLVGIVALVKPYVLVPLALGFGAWFYAGRGGRIRLGYKVLGLVLAVGGVLAVGRAFPAYGVDQVAETIATTQENFASANTAAGSGIEMGERGGEQSLAGSLKWAPLGLLNALARPMIFDIRNGATAIAALEMTLVVWIVVSLVRRHGVRRVLREISSQPPFLFSAVFVLAFGTSVGLATANLGTLSRYRVPMMPMYVASVLVIRARLDKGREQATRRPISPSVASRAIRPRMQRHGRPRGAATGA